MVLNWLGPRKKLFIYGFLNKTGYIIALQVLARKAGPEIVFRHGFKHSGYQFPGIACKKQEYKI
jgi:hypothetical protein